MIVSAWRLLPSLHETFVVVKHKLFSMPGPITFKSKCHTLPIRFGDGLQVIRMRCRQYDKWPI